MKRTMVAATTQTGKETGGKTERFAADVRDYQVLGLRPAESRVPVIRQAAQDKAHRLRTSERRFTKTNDELSQIAFATYRLLDPRRRLRFGERIQLCIGDDLTDLPSIPSLSIPTPSLRDEEEDQPTEAPPRVAVDVVPLAQPSIERKIAMELAEHHWEFRQKRKKHSRRWIAIASSTTIAIIGLVGISIWIISSLFSPPATESSPSVKSNGKPENNKQPLATKIAPPQNNPASKNNSVTQNNSATPNSDAAKSNAAIENEASRNELTQPPLLAPVSPKTTGLNTTGPNTTDAPSPALEPPTLELNEQDEQNQPTELDMQAAENAFAAATPPQEKKNAKTSPAQSDQDAANEISEDLFMPLPEEPTEAANNVASEKPNEADPNGAAAGALLHPAPDAASLKKARELVDSLFGDKIKDASSKDELIKLAIELQEVTRQSPEGSADRLALLEKLTLLLGQASQYRASLMFCDQIEEQFQQSAWETRKKLFEESLKRTTHLDSQKEVARLSLALLDLAIADEEFELANEIARSSATLTNRIGDDQLRSAMRDLREGIVSGKKLALQAKKGEEKLVGDSEDRFSHTACGLHACLVRRDWPVGLVHFSKGSDKDWASLAQRELANPVAAEEQHALARDYLAQAESQKGRMKSSVLLHAKQWAEKAEPIASGLLKAEVSSTLKKITIALPEDWLGQLDNQFIGTTDMAAAEDQGELFLVPHAELLGMVGRVVNAGEDSGIMIRYGSGLAIDDAQMTDLLTRVNQIRGDVRLELRGLITVTRETEIRIVHQAGSEKGQGIVAVDGKVLGQVGGDSSAERSVYKTKLTPGEHVIVWRLAGSVIGQCALQVQKSDDQAVPIYHSPAMLAQLNQLRTRLRVDIVRAAN